LIATFYIPGLYKQSLKILDKTKTIALENDEKYMAFEIVEFEKLIESQYIRSIQGRRRTSHSSKGIKLSQHYFEQTVKFIIALWYYVKWAM
jgi:hypothetical protein